MSSTTCLNDDTLGPFVRGCRGNFDFTYKFEGVFLSILPSAIFIALAIARVALLVRRNTIVKGIRLQYAKLVAIAVYSGLEISALLLLNLTEGSDPLHVLFRVSTALAFVCSLFLLALSYAEHRNTTRPSTLIWLYLLLTILFDIALTRTAWLSIHHVRQRAVACVLTTAVAVKAIILLLEMTPKTQGIEWNEKNHSPEETSGLLSLSVYWWLNGLFKLGYTQVLAVHDLHAIDAQMSVKVVQAKFTAKLDRARLLKHPRTGLLRECIRIFWWPFVQPVIPRLAYVAFTFCQPLLINTTLNYAVTPDVDRVRGSGYGLIGATILIYLGLAISNGLYGYYKQRAVFTLRAALVAEIYDQTMELQATDLDDSAALTLMSTDMDKVMQGLLCFHDLWADVIQTALASWLLYLQLGLAFLAPVCLVLVCTGGLVFILRSMNERQGQWMSAIQARVASTSNALCDMRLYKIAGIIQPVSHILNHLRLTEVQIGNKWRWYLIMATTLGAIPAALGPVLTFVLSAKFLDTAKVYTSLSYVLLVTSPLSSFFQSLPIAAAAGVSLKRMQEYLIKTPRFDFRESRFGGKEPHTDGRPHTLSKDMTETAFEIRDGEFGWATGNMTLHSINISLPTGSTTLIMGPVASGKSTFCRILLGELPVHGGKVLSHSSDLPIGYCDQTPFLYNASIQENIVGHSSFSQAKYDEAITATLLDVDIQRLPKGHHTIIGSGGATLSGGQKQRVSVARAVYSNAQTMIFDDVLSGLDATTEKEVWRRVFGPEGLLRKRRVTAIICTNSMRSLPSDARVFSLGPSGTLLEQSPYNEVMKINALISHQSVEQESPTSSNTELDISQQDESSIRETGVEATVASFMDQSRQNGDRAVYLHYIKSISILGLLTCIIGSLLFAFGNDFGSVWLNYYASNTFQRSDNFYIGIYALLKVSALLAFFCTGVACLISIVTNSGINLHDTTVATVVGASMQFLSTTDTGVILNLFSQDMSLIDGELPIAVLNVCLTLAQVISGAAVVGSSSPWLIISYPAIAGILYLVQKVYLRTSRQLRLLDLEAKSPLYSHFSDTIKGVVSIRAFGWQESQSRNHCELLDTSQRPAYLLALIQQWLATLLELLVGCITVGVVAYATQGRANAGVTGASLVILTQLGDKVAGLITYYTNLETAIGAVSRLKTFASVVHSEERAGGGIEPPPGWPHRGHIDINRVSASYDLTSGRDELPNVVLNNVNLRISSGEKIAICGRTGSGKSTLLLLLLRLLDPLPGSCHESIVVDDIPLHLIDRKALRKRIIAIPQTPVFLPSSSSIKDNLDPYQESTESEALSVLGLVGLQILIQGEVGIGALISTNELSSGQKQLFALARAVLRKRARDRLAPTKGQGGILLLDEITSSVDKKTESFMQEIIMDEFSHYTIVMVSHRLDMVMCFDTVIVVDMGHVVETGNPRELLLRQRGAHFRELWASAGSHEGVLVTPSVQA